MGSEILDVWEKYDKLWWENRDYVTTYTFNQLHNWLLNTAYWYGVSRGYQVRKESRIKYMDVYPAYSSLDYYWWSGYGVVDVVIKDFSLLTIDRQQFTFRVFGKGDDPCFRGDKKKAQWAVEFIEQINNKIKAALRGINQENSYCFCSYCGQVRICELTLKQWLCGDCQKRIHSSTDESEKGYVYFLTSALGNDIKIGWARSDPQKRIATFCLPDAKLLALEEGDRSRESELHRKFTHLRLEGSEWFSPGPELMNYIENLGETP